MLLSCYRAAQQVADPNLIAKASFFNVAAVGVRDERAPRTCERQCVLLAISRARHCLLHARKHRRRINTFSFAIHLEEVYAGILHAPARTNATCAFARRRHNGLIDGLMVATHATDEH
jgi:hypothetical protein